MKYKTFTYFILSSFFFLFISNSFSQSFGAYRSNAAQMSWDATSNWQTWDTASSSWVTSTTSPDSSNGTVHIRQGHTVIVSSTLIIDQLIIEGTLTHVGSKLIITDGIGDDLAIRSGGKVINESNSTFINQGQLIMQDSIINKSVATFLNEGIILNEQAYFKNTGKMINGDKSTLINSGDILTGGTITFENNSLYQHQFSSSQPIAGTIPVATWNQGSTCEIIACGDAFQPGALNQTFHHFIWNNSTQPHDFNLIANPNKVNGNFEVKNTNQKRLTYKGGSAGDLVVSDSFKITGGIFSLSNGTGSTTIQTSNYYQQAGILDMSASSAPCSLFVSADFIHSAGIIQCSGSSASCCFLINGMNPSRIVSNGFKTGNPLSFIIGKQNVRGTCTVPIQQSFVLHQGTTFSLSDNSAVSIDLQIEGTFNFYTNSWDLTKGVTDVTGNLINNTTLPVARNSTTKSLNFNATSFYVHAGDGGEVVSAAWDATSTVHITGMEKNQQLKNGGQHFGNILWNCMKQQQSGFFGENGFGVRGNYTIESTGEGVLHFPDCDFEIGGDLSLHHTAQLQLATGEGLYIPNRRSIQIHGNLIVQHQAFIRVGNPNTGNSARGINESRNYELQLKKDFIYTSSTPLISYHHRSYENGSKNESYNLVLTFNGSQLQHYTLAPQPTELVQVQPTEYICNNAYKLLISGKGTHLVPQIYNLKIHHLQINETDTLTIAKEDIHIDQFSLFTAKGKQPPFCAVYGTLDMGMNTLKETKANEGGVFQLMKGATLITKHEEGIEKSATTGCILNSGERLFDEAANYIYNGSLSQVTGSGLPSILSGSLIIENDVSLLNGGVTLSKPTLVNGMLHLNKGKLITHPTSLITISNSGIVLPEGGTSNSFVDGFIMKTGLTSGKEFIFPLGNKNKWARVSITPLITSTDTFSAAYFMNNPGLQNSIEHDFSLQHISSKEYWTLNKTGDPASALIKLYWESGSFSSIYSIQSQDLSLAHADTIGMKCKWKSETTAVVTLGSPDKGTIQARAVLHPSGLFTFGSATGINPLPVQLLSFTGNAESKGNQLNWVTASERNNQYFIIQRSADGNQFSEVGILNGHGNSNSLLQYTYFDSLVTEINWYYRLKQVDGDEKYSYSAIIQIDNNNTKIPEIIIFPNPASEDPIHLFIGKGVKSFSIYNLLGKRMLEDSIDNETNEYLFEPAASGIYFLKAVTFDGKEITKKIIKN